MKNSHKAGQFLKVLVLRFLICSCRFTVQLHSVDHLLCAVSHLQCSGESGEGRFLPRLLPYVKIAIENEKRTEKLTASHTQFCASTFVRTLIDVILQCLTLMLTIYNLTRCLTLTLALTLTWTHFTHQPFEDKRTSKNTLTPPKRPSGIPFLLLLMQ